MIYVYMNKVPNLTDKSLLMLRSVQGSPISRLHTLQVPKVSSEFGDVKLGSTELSGVYNTIYSDKNYRYIIAKSST